MHARNHVYRARGDRFRDQNIALKHVSGKVTANFWGWISAFGPGEIVRIRGRFTGNLNLMVNVAKE